MSPARRRRGSPSTRWAAITPRRRSSTGRWRRRGISGVAVTLVGRRDVIAAELTRHADADALDVQVVDAADVVAMDEVAGVGAAPQAPGVDPRRHRAGARSGRRGGGQRRAHRRLGGGCPRRVRDAEGRRSAGAGAVDSDPARHGRPARRRRHRRVQAGAPPAVRRDGRGLRRRAARAARRRGSGCCRSAKRKAKATT